MDWFDKGNMIVSGEVGLVKPEKEIFELAEKRMGLDKATTYYIGDSFQHDVIGAKNVGWQAVWSNHRHLQPIDSPYTYDFLVNETSTLLSFVQSVLPNEND